LRTLRLTLEYDGTDLAGWQRQPAPFRTVQAFLEDALERITGAHAHVQGSGRTDAGVHARGQVASVVTASAIPAAGLARGMNALLPRDVAVTALDEAPEGFDARRAARGKIYAYRIWNEPHRSPLHARTSWHVVRPLALEPMRAAAASLLGEHDFSAFRAAGCDAKNPVRILRRIDLAADGPLLTLTFEGTAFLRNMVRILTGTLVDVGHGRFTPADVAAMLAGRDRTAAGKTAPPEGLCLEQVLY
jgi:tRNA pseudouridine38-40 synthase